MPDIASLIQSGLGNPWLLVPTALVLGALHALEPGHSKSMMTAFIVAVNGTVKQAILLAIAATVGHTIVVWALALAAWQLGDSELIERAEPWLLLLGGMLLVVLALRMLSRLGILGTQSSHHAHGSHSHDHQHDHHHGHHNTHDHAHGHSHAPHPPFESEDAHAAYHAGEVQRQFAGRKATSVSNGEVAWFGFTGGLLPCPAAFAVLLVCLKSKAYGLGVVMVAAFSLGLALMLVGIGVGAAWGANALRQRSATFDRWSQRAPIISAIVVLLIGLTTMWAGVRALS